MIIGNQKPIAIIGPAASSMTHEFVDEISRTHQVTVIEPELFLKMPDRHQFQYILACWKDFEQRKQIVLEIDRQGIDLVTVIQDTTMMGRLPPPEIGAGCFIFGFSRIGLGSHIGRHTIVGAYSLIGHYSVVGSGCVLRPGVMITGKSRIGNHCVMNLKSTVTNTVEIVDNVTIMALSAVTKNISRPGRYIGTPARRVTSIQDT